jgi:hypothetical protein
MTNCSVQIQAAFMVAALIFIIWVALEAYRKMFEGATDPSIDNSQTTVVKSESSLSWWQKILIFFGFMKAPEKDTTIIVNNNTTPGQPIVIEDNRSTTTGTDNSRQVASTGDVTPNPQATANATAAADAAAQAKAASDAAAKAVTDAKTAADAKAAADAAAAAQKAAADALAKISVKSIIFKSPETNIFNLYDWRAFGFSKVVIYTKDGAQMPSNNIKDITDINYGSGTEITMATSTLCYLRGNCSTTPVRSDLHYAIASSGPTLDRYNTLSIDKQSGIKFVFNTPIVISKIDLYNHHNSCDTCPLRLNGVIVELYSDEASTNKIGSFTLDNFSRNTNNRSNDILARQFVLNSDYSTVTSSNLAYPYPTN